jgi:hypothetical protein
MLLAVNKSKRIILKALLLFICAAKKLQSRSEFCDYIRKIASSRTLHFSATPRAIFFQRRESLLK